MSVPFSRNVAKLWYIHINAPWMWERGWFISVNCQLRYSTVSTRIFGASEQYASIQCFSTVLLCLIFRVIRQCRAVWWTLRQRIYRRACREYRERNRRRIGCRIRNGRDRWAPAPTAASSLAAISPITNDPKATVSPPSINIRTILNDIFTTFAIFSICTR